MESLIRIPGYVGPSNKLAAQRFDCQVTKNMFVEVSPFPGKEGDSSFLLSRPGLELRANLPGVGTVRGIYTSVDNTTCFAVRGSRVYSSTDNFVTYTHIGTLTTSDGPVAFCDNGSSVLSPEGVLVDGTYGYSFTIAAPAATFKRINDTHFLPATSVTFQDGYFIFNAVGTPYYFTSDVNTLTPFPASNTAMKAGYGDKIVGLISNNRELLLFGTKTIEYWYNAGGTLTPFSRIDGKFNNVGCVSAATIRKLGDTVYWLGPNEQGGVMVFSLESGNPTRTSNHAVELAIQQATKTQLAAAVAWSYQANGHFFYVLQIPGLDTTWVFDAATKLWHERTSTDVNNEQMAFIGQCCTYSVGEFLVGSNQDGAIMVMKDDAFTDAGRPILRLRASPHVSTEMTNMFCSMFQLDIQAGVGTDLDAEPMITLRVSRDGGKTYGLPLKASIGKVGKWVTRQRWRRLGYGRDLVFEVSTTDEVALTILSAWVQLEKGNA